MDGLALIGGALSSQTLVAPLRRLMPVHILHPLLATRPVLSLAFGPLPGADLQQLGVMLEATPDALLQEGARLATGYFPSLAPLCPVYVIHGARDRLMRRPPAAGWWRMPATHWRSPARKR